MEKDIVVLSNGTGHEGCKAAATDNNVHRLFNMMESRISSGSFWQKLNGNGADVKMQPCTWSQHTCLPLTPSQSECQLKQRFVANGALIKAAPCIHTHWVLV